MGLTIQASYSGGVLIPQDNLNLPENTLVQVEITSVAADALKRKTLFGAVPELAALSNAMVDDLILKTGNLDCGLVGD